MTMKNEEVSKEAEELAEELSGGHWNTRICKKHVHGKYNNGKEYNETYMGVFETYYKEDDTIWAISKEPISIQFKDKEEFEEILKQIIEASKRTIVDITEDKLKFIDTGIIMADLDSDKDVTE